jgi:hypothetical protein
MKVEYKDNIRTLDVCLTGKRFYLVAHRTITPWASYRKAQGNLTEIIGQGWFKTEDTGIITLSDHDEILAFLKLSKENYLCILDKQVLCSLGSKDEDGQTRIGLTGDYHYRDGSMMESKCSRYIGYMEGMKGQCEFVAEKNISPAKCEQWKKKGFRVVVRKREHL